MKHLHQKLGLFVLLILLLSACAPTAPTTDVGTSPADTAEGVELTPPGEFPIVQEPVTLRVAVVANSLVEDFATNAFTEWYEDLTNVHIEWEVIPSSGAAEKLNLMLASGDLPDVLMDFNVSPAQLMIYGEQGTFLALNDLIEEQGVYTKEMFAGSPQVEDLLKAPDGNIYALPEVNECYHCTLAQRFWINKPWLDALGLEIPTTTEELYQVLKAFKEQDPNGNGIADEIPLAGAIMNNTSAIDGYLMAPFVLSNPFNNAERLLLNDGQISAAFTTPEWKEGLTYLNRLYSEGLLSDQSFTQEVAQLRQMGENPDVPILGSAPALGPNVVAQVYGESGRWLDFTAVPPLKGPSGQQITPHNPFGVTLSTFIITSAAENPAVAFRWADGMYVREHTLRSVFGRLGEDWRWAEEGEVGIDGSAAIWERGQTFGQVQNVAWAQSGPTYRPNALRLGEVGAEGEERPKNLETLLYDETKAKYEPYAQPADTIIPPLFFTQDQSAELADLSLTITDYVNEMVARFTTGDADIEAEWDTYLETLSAMGLERYLEIYQEAYDAKYAQ